MMEHLLQGLYGVYTPDNVLFNAVPGICLASAVTKYCADAKIKWCKWQSKHSEQLLNQNKSIKQKQLLIFHSKTKLSIDVWIILANMK